MTASYTYLGDGVPLKKMSGLEQCVMTLPAGAGIDDLVMRIVFKVKIIECSLGEDCGDIPSFSSEATHDWPVILDEMRRQGWRGRVMTLAIDSTQSAAGFSRGGWVGWNDRYDHEVIDGSLALAVCRAALMACLVREGGATDAG